MIKAHAEEELGFPNILRLVDTLGILMGERWVLKCAYIVTPVKYSEELLARVAEYNRSSAIIIRFDFYPQSVSLQGRQINNRNLDRPSTPA
jgi:hypothetical protein